MVDQSVIAKRAVALLIMAMCGGFVFFVVNLPELLESALEYFERFVHWRYWR